MTRILLTGADGFTGEYVGRALTARGHEVVGTTRRPGLAAGALRTLDLRDPDATLALVRDVAADAVIHLAAIAHVAHADVSDMYLANVVGTRNLLHALAAASRPPARVVLASSANVYGNSDRGVLDEDTPLMPANDYGISKLAVEHLARVWSSELPIVTVRPFNYTGRGQSERFLVPKIVAHFRDRRPAISLGNIDVSRDYSDVRMVAQAYAGLVEAARPPAVLNIASGIGHSIRDILERMAAIAGYEIAVTVDPALVRRNEIRELAGTDDRLRASVRDLPAFSLADTLRWMYGE